MLRRLSLGTALLALAALLLALITLGPFALRLRHFPADPTRGYAADFYLYVSPGAQRGARAEEIATLLVQPNNSGINSDNPEVHRRDAWWTAFGRHWLANDLEVILLVPAFVRPAEDWWIYTHALDRDSLITDRPDLVRPDLQLLAMVEAARTALAEEGVNAGEKMLLQGYSASGMFANRFTAIHPTRVLAVATGSPGGWPIAPASAFGDETLPYPAGVADLEALTGQPFNSSAYRAIPQLIVMGTLDDNDSLDYRDGWDEALAAQVEQLFGTTPLARWAAAQALYAKASANTEFLLVEGVGHDRRALQAYSTVFFKRILADLR